MAVALEEVLVGGQRKQMVWVRWLAVVPAAYLGWWAALIFGIMLLNLAESFCPPSEMISGMCVAWWFHYGEKAIFAFSAALAAFLVIVLPVLVTPSHRHVVAWSAFIGGGAVAVVLGWQLAA